MKVDYETFVQSAKKYVLTKVAPTLSCTGDQFLVGLFHRTVEGKIRSALPVLEAGGSAADGKVDIDKLDEDIKVGFETAKDGKASFPVPSVTQLMSGNLFGLTSAETDAGANAEKPKITFSPSDWEEFKRMLC